MRRDLKSRVAGLAVALRLEKAEMRMRLLDAAVFAENVLCLGLTADCTLPPLASELEFMRTIVTLAVRAQNTLDYVHFVAKPILLGNPSRERCAWP